MITSTEAKAAEAFCAAIDAIEAPAPQPPNPILDALDLLHRTYPGERVDIWASYRKHDVIDYTAMVQGIYPDKDDTAWSQGTHLTPQSAAESLLKEAGDRSRATRIAKRLAQLQDELTKLQAEAKEVA